MEMVQLASDGIWEGDQFKGNYGPYVTNPFGRSPVRLNDFGNQTVTIDTYLTYDGLMKTLRFLGLPTSIPIAVTGDEYRDYIADGHKQIIKATESTSGTKYGPAMYDLWWKKDWHSDATWDADSANLWGVAQNIIRNGVDAEKAHFWSVHSKPYEAWSENDNWGVAASGPYIGQVIDMNTGLPVGQESNTAGGTVLQTASVQTQNQSLLSPTVTSTQTGSSVSPTGGNPPQISSQQTVISESDKTGIYSEIDIAGVKIPVMVLGVVAVLGFMAMKGK